MRFIRISAVIVTAGLVVLAPASALAQGKGHGPKAPHGNPHTATAAPTQHGNPHAAAPPAPQKTHGNPHTRPAATTGSSTLANKIHTQPVLETRLTGLLPPGMNLDQASAGFRNQGQFIAALHVARNLNIPFADLRRDMVDRHMSLGQSIQALRPGDNRDAVRRAQQEANEDVRSARAPKTNRRPSKHRS